MSGYGRNFGLLRRAAGSHWGEFTGHAFVKGLGDGTLPTECYLHYLVQDYLFLVHFARAWALVVTRAERVEQMRLAAATVNALINEEMALHVSTCAGAGIGIGVLESTTERPENIAYTRYVLDVGYSGDLLDLLVVLAPCVMGYGEIGVALEKGATSDIYRAWIATYAGAAYQRMCIDVGLLIDKAVDSRLGEAPEANPRWPVLCERFSMATRLETGFWEMGLRP